MSGRKPIRFVSPTIIIWRTWLSINTLIGHNYLKKEWVQGDTSFYSLATKPLGSPWFLVYNNENRLLSYMANTRTFN